MQRLDRGFADSFTAFKSLDGHLCYGDRNGVGARKIVDLQETSCLQRFRVAGPVVTIEREAVRCRHSCELAIRVVGCQLRVSGLSDTW